MRLWKCLQPNKTKPFSWHSNLRLLAMLVWGEARGTTFKEKVSVAWVVKNRKDYPSWWGSGWQGVILKPYQFSCFNATDPNRQKMREPLEYDSQEVWEECCIAAAVVYSDIVEDPTGGADHYFSGSLTPSWANNQQPTAIIGPFKFYKLRVL